MKYHELISKKASKREEFQYAEAMPVSPPVTLPPSMMMLGPAAAAFLAGYYGASAVDKLVNRGLLRTPPSNVPMLDPIVTKKAAEELRGWVETYKAENNKMPSLEEIKAKLVELMPDVERVPGALDVLPQLMLSVVWVGPLRVKSNQPVKVRIISPDPVNSRTIKEYETTAAKAIDELGPPDYAQQREGGLIELLYYDLPNGPNSKPIYREPQSKETTVIDGTTVELYEPVRVIVLEEPATPTHGNIVKEFEMTPAEAIDRFGWPTGIQRGPDGRVELIYM